MVDGMVACHELRGGHAPFHRCGRYQHFTCRCAGRPQQVEMFADAGRAVGILVAVLGIAERLQQLYAVPVGFEFVRDHLRKRSPDALPHFRTMTIDLYDVVIANIDVDVRRHAAGAGCFRATRSSERHRENKAAARNTGLLQKLPPTQFLQTFHDSPPAARWIALRIRV